MSFVSSAQPEHPAPLPPIKIITSIHPWHTHYQTGKAMATTLGNLFLTCVGIITCATTPNNGPPTTLGDGAEQG